MRRLPCPSPWLLAVLLLLGLARPAWAEVFCVATAVDLQNALILTAANGQDDEVRVVQGTYVGYFVYASTEAKALSVLGGYTAGCAERVLDPVNTVLDGNQTGTVLKLSATTVAAGFVVEGLTLRKGNNSGLGVTVGLGGRVSLQNNLISGNTSSTSSGGGVNLSATTVMIKNNNISGNIAICDGGGLYLYATTVLLTDNTITGNSTHSSNGSSCSPNNGGGIYLKATTATLTNNNISDNTSYTRGGGLCLISTVTTLTNNTIVGNSSGYGGGLYLDFQGNEPQRSLALSNNLFWLNRATPNQGADFYINNTTASQVTLRANNFDWTPNTEFWVGTPVYLDSSNLNKLDPLFVDASTGDFHLQPGSPMIDAGYPGTPDLPDFDIEGTPRVLGSSVDIGAYEYDDGSDPKAILTLTLAGDGSGTVSSNPSGINCGSDCAQAYDLDTLVTLTATPADAHSTFDGWSGDADCADGQVTLTTHLSCTATFSAVRQLTVTRAGGGDGLVTSAPSGISCGAACAAYFYLGETVTLTAVPDAISTFASWSGDPTCPHPVLTVDRACTANFSPLLYCLYLFVYGSGGGTVISTPAGINCGADCEQDYRAGTVITLTAAANANSTFWGWTGPCTGANPICEVTLSAVRGLAAIFNLKTYLLSVTKSGTGTGTVTSAPGTINCGNQCQETFDHGASVTLTATPDATATFTGWSGGGCSGTGSCQVNMTAARSVTASFTLNSYTVTATAGAHGSIDPASRSVAHGSTTSFTVTAETGYSASVSGCGGSLTGNTYTTGPITAACTVKATFVPQVTVVATDNVATEKGLTTGTYTFTRTGATTSALTVSYRVTGTATSGQDYQALGTSVKFPVGASQVTKILVPLQDTLVEPNETVILTLLPRAAYALGNPASARIILRSDD